MEVFNLCASSWLWCVEFFFLLPAAYPLLLRDLGWFTTVWRYISYFFFAFFHYLFAIDEHVSMTLVPAGWISLVTLASREFYLFLHFPRRHLVHSDY